MQEATGPAGGRAVWPGAQRPQGEGLRADKQRQREDPAGDSAREVVVAGLSTRCESI